VTGEIEPCSSPMEISPLGGRSPSHAPVPAETASMCWTPRSTKIPEENRFGSGSRQMFGTDEQHLGHGASVLRAAGSCAGIAAFSHQARCVRGAVYDRGGRNVPQDFRRPHQERAVRDGLRKASVTPAAPGAGDLPGRVGRGRSDGKTELLHQGARLRRVKLCRTAIPPSDPAKYRGAGLHRPGEPVSTGRARNASGEASAAGGEERPHDSAIAASRHQRRKRLLACATLDIARRVTSASRGRESQSVDGLGWDRRGAPAPTNALGISRWRRPSGR